MNRILMGGSFGLDACMQVAQKPSSYMAVASSAKRGSNGQGKPVRATVTVVQNILNRLHQSQSAVPMLLRVVLFELRCAVAVRFPEHEERVRT